MSADLFAPPARPSTWRAPTTGEHVCSVCQGAACYGYGATWYCREHVPAGFLPGQRSAG